MRSTVVRSLPMFLAGATAIVTGSTAHVLAQTIRQDAELGDLLERERRIRILAHRARLSPEPMQLEDLRHFLTSLSLDEQQTAVVEQQFQNYLDRVRRLRETHGRNVETLWPAAFEYDRVQRMVVPIYAPPLLELYQEHVQYLGALIDAERSLFAAIRHVAPESEGAELYRMHNERLRSLIDFPEEAPLVTLDVASLLEASEIDIGAADPARPLEPLLHQYRREMNETLLDAVLRLRRDVDQPRAGLLVERSRRSADRLGDQGESIAFSQSLDGIAETERAILARIAGINVIAIERIITRLDEEQAKRVRSELYREIWPELIDEEEHIASIAAVLLNMLEEEAPSRESLEATLETVRTRLASTMRQALESRVIDPPLRSGSGGSGGAGAPAEADIDRRIATLQTQLEELLLRRERREILKSLAMASLHAVADVEDSEFADDLRRLRDSLEARDEADEWLAGSIEEQINSLRLRQEAERLRDRDDR